MGMDTRKFHKLLEPEQLLENDLKPVLRDLPIRTGLDDLEHALETIIKMCLDCRTLYDSELFAAPGSLRCKACAKARKQAQNRFYYNRSRDDYDQRTHAWTAANPERYKLIRKGINERARAKLKAKNALQNEGGIGPEEGEGQLALPPREIFLENIEDNHV